MTRAAYFWIGIGSALGGMARFWLSGVSARLFGEALPWGTLLVNVSGSLIIGFFATLSGPGGRLDVDPSMRLFVMVGLCGGYTTFSAFSLQTLALMQEGAGLGEDLSSSRLSCSVCSPSGSATCWRCSSVSELTGKGPRLKSPSLLPPRYSSGTHGVLKCILCVLGLCNA